MKQNKKINSEYSRIRKLFAHTKALAEKASMRNLWEQERVVRKRVNFLSRIKAQDQPADYARVFADYTGLYAALSRRILSDYNRVHTTNFVLEDVIDGRENAYYRSGILAVLLTSHIPGILSDAFKRFLPRHPKDEYPEARAIRREFTLHIGGTNTGKTHNSIERLCEVGEGVYCAPLRVLALEIFERLNLRGVPCSLRTGEEEINVPNSLITSCTVEKLDINKEYALAIIDEVQMVGSSQRGAAWSRAILGARAKEVHLCGAENVLELVQEMITDCHDRYTTIHYKRDIPLEIDRSRHPLANIQQGDAIIAFSRKKVIAIADDLTARGIPAAVIYGDLPPEARRLQYAAFLSREKRVLVSTDAIGMGVNLPIRRIIFTELRKYDGESTRPLTSQEIKQIAGRAGRRGIYDIGYVATADGEWDYLADALEADDPPVTQAVIGPSEVLARMGLLPLREKLALWATREDATRIYSKLDTRAAVLLLDSLTQFKLSEEAQWKLIYLPFDVYNKDLLDLLIMYIDEVFVLGLREVDKPQLERRDLSALELYYQAVNLYYAFSRTFDLNYDQRWIDDTRHIVSEEINRLLNGKKRANARQRSLTLTGY
jgi:ATP-dependent RNA helicase SUPV3L1/SUV3